MAANHHPQLASEVQRVLRDRRLTLRQAAIATEVGYSTIFDMKEGKRPSAETLVHWARALGEEPASWLRAAGYTELADLLLRPRRASAPELRREPTYDDLPGDLQQVHGLHGAASERDVGLPGELAEILGLQDMALHKVAQLPPGRARDTYIARLRADAVANLQLIAERLEREAADSPAEPGAGPAADTGGAP